MGFPPLPKFALNNRLASKSGMHWTYLGGIERGERSPSLRNVAAIAKALDVTLPQLFLFGGQESGSRTSKNLFQSRWWAVQDSNL